MEAHQKQVTEEFNCLSRELQECKDAYDSYERKDIQYHETLKANKANLKKLRSKLEENSKQITQHQDSEHELSARLERLEKEVVEMQRKKEQAEEELAELLTKFKAEINQLKEQRSEIEVFSGIP